MKYICKPGYSRIWRREWPPAGNHFHTGERESRSRGQRIKLFNFSSTQDSQSKALCVPRWPFSPASLACCYSLMHTGSRAPKKLATPSPPLICKGMACRGVSMQVADRLAALELGRMWLSSLALRMALCLALNRNQMKLRTRAWFWKVSSRQQDASSSWSWDLRTHQCYHLNLGPGLKPEPQPAEAPHYLPADL